MAITEAQLTERAATAQAIEHLKAARALLRPLPDLVGLFAAVIDDMETDIDALDQVYGETFVEIEIEAD